MFNADPKILAQLQPALRKVLVIDPAPVSARLASDLMKEIGAQQIVVASKSSRAMAAAQEFEPQIILTEFAGDDLDGLAFTKALRRSGLICRQVPVIMITAEATAASIIGARNAGVHEFLRKPYTAGDLFRRVSNVVLKPRPWIEAQMYVGPDRRRFNDGEFAGARKRRSDGGPPKTAAA